MQLARAFVLCTPQLRLSAPCARRSRGYVQAQTEWCCSARSFGTQYKDGCASDRGCFDPESTFAYMLLCPLNSLCMGPQQRPPHRQSESISSSAVCKSLRATDSTQTLVTFCGHLCARRLARHKRSDCFGVPAERSTQFRVLSSVCAVLLFGLQVSRPSSKRHNLASWSMFKIVRTKKYMDSMYAQCVFPLCVCISVGCIVL